jgi:hypothetical protein
MALYAHSQHTSLRARRTLSMSSRLVTTAHQVKQPRPRGWGGPRARTGNSAIKLNCTFCEHLSRVYLRARALSKQVSSYLAELSLAVHLLRRGERGDGGTLPSARPCSDNLAAYDAAGAASTTGGQTLHPGSEWADLVTCGRARCQRHPHPQRLGLRALEPLPVEVLHACHPN